MMAQRSEGPRPDDDPHGGWVAFDFVRCVACGMPTNWRDDNGVGLCEDCRVPYSQQ
jgi:hypothetical protein